MRNNNNVEAIYNEQIIDEYSGNPFIEALPLINSKPDVINMIACYPKFDGKEREYEAHIRLHLVQRIFQYFQPLPVHLDLEAKISRIIRGGYISRNPITPEYVRSFNNGYRDIQSGNLNYNSSDNFVTTSSGFSLIGVSGMGKSTIISKILNLMPEVIVHSKYKGKPFTMTQLTYLKLDCPFDGSLKALCLEYFGKIDSILGSNYFQKYHLARLSANAMLPIINQISRTVGLGLIVVDEIQNLSLSKGGGSEKMLNYFVSLINLSIPVILVGTPKAMPILQSEFRQARRGQGDMVWDRLHKDEHWNLLIEGLWDYQWVKKPQKISQEFLDVLYDESQGIIDIAIKIFFMAQVRAISSRKEIITCALIKKVADENLKLVKPMLQSLKNGRNMTSYNDFMVLDVSNFINNEQNQINLNSSVDEFKRAKEEKRKIQDIDIKEVVVIKLIDLGFEESEINRYIEQIPNLDETGINKLTRTLLNLLMKTGNSNVAKKKTSKREKIVLKDEDDIRFIARRCKKEETSIYDGLKNNSYIKDFESLIREVV
ncbi:MAG TPA: ATP-binding protein [Clostridium sp.]|uniref:ATP-binding protein n=1 Tax=Clostridium sp. TaxID=1506 RepID=UPI002F951813